MGHFKTFAKGVALGGLVGILYGLFTAPKKGSAMQKEAKSTIKKLVKKEKKFQKKIEPKVKKAATKARKMISKAQTGVKKNNKRKKK